MQGLTCGGCALADLFRFGRRDTIIEEKPVVRGVRGITFGAGNPQAKALVEMFLALPQVLPPLPPSSKYRGACGRPNDTSDLHTPLYPLPS